MRKQKERNGRRQEEERKEREWGNYFFLNSDSTKEELGN